MLIFYGVSFDVEVIQAMFIYKSCLRSVSPSYLLSPGFMFLGSDLCYDGWPHVKYHCLEDVCTNKQKNLLKVKKQL